eukprot:gnl/MRDRNA2_/MRDRNA2_180601_c0_seq1.p1 gnl/MRDRNA2_/MRDRNA2_180601_c0~~gnl/MRDRNA2_/MRDRNA2_180601_c0_seq1.p1  ORF type:complete len:234 (+),score=45.84 gnl/MRDRNA2_/MRDRNA2_180601_c0_seq1:100-702(+)
MVPSLIVRSASQASLTATTTPSDMEEAMNQTLLLLIMHFFVLYMVQVCVQLTVISVDFASEKNYLEVGLHSRDFLTAADFFVVLLFFVEVAVQVMVQGTERWLKNWWHKFDIVVLVVSVLVLTIDIAQVSLFQCGREEQMRQEFSGAWEEEFELLRDLVRLVRIALFCHELKDLLNRPLEHFAMLAEELNPQAHEVNDYI